MGKPCGKNTDGENFVSNVAVQVNGERGFSLELFMRGYRERKGKPIHNYAERFHIEPFQSPLVNAV